MLLSHVIVPLLVCLIGLAYSYAYSTSDSFSRNDSIWTSLFSAGKTLLLVSVVVYAGYFFGLILILIYLYQSDLLRKSLEALAILIILFLGIPSIILLPTLLNPTYLWETREILARVATASFLILSYIFLPNLRRSIDRAIHKRMADE